MNDDQLLRYSRHILLDEIGIEGQVRLMRGRALVIGAGGLGSPVALYLATSGVGRITLVDDDTVDLTNLQRQILFAMSDVGSAKVDAAACRLAAINPEIQIAPLRERVDGERLERLVAAADVVLDCTDNFATRHAINRACVNAQRPLVSGAAIRFDGQIAVFDMRSTESPCYHCLFGDGEELEETRCATMGVFAPLVGIVGATQAAEALKILAGVGVTLAGRLLLIDALTMQWRELRVPRDSHCEVCASRRGHPVAEHRSASAE